MIFAAVNRCLFGDKKTVEVAVSDNSIVRECQLFGKLGTVITPLCLLVSLCMFQLASWCLAVMLFGLTGLCYTMLTERLPVTVFAFHRGGQMNDYLLKM